MEHNLVKSRLIIKGLVAFAILAVCLVAFIAGLHYLQNIYQEKLDRQIHANRVIALANRIQIDCTEVVLTSFAKQITNTVTARDRIKFVEMTTVYDALRRELETEKESPAKQRRLKLIGESMQLCLEIVRGASELQSRNEEGFGGLRALTGSLHTFNKLRILFEQLGIDIRAFNAPYQN